MKALFQSFWFGDSITPYESLCFRSFIDRGHDFQLYTYTHNLSVPAGVRLCDAGEILDESDYFTYQGGAHTGSHAAFSNLFRYALLAERGGWWVDTDVVCLRDDLPTFDEFFAWEDTDAINGAVLYFKKGDPIMLKCLELAREIGNAPAWGEIGYKLLTRVIRSAGRADCAQPPVTCYPLHYNEFLDVLVPAKADLARERTRSSLFLHLWSEMFRLNGIPKTMLPPRGSFLRQMADRHQADGWSGEHDISFLERTLSIQREREDFRHHIEELAHQIAALSQRVRELEAQTAQ